MSKKELTKESLAQAVEQLNDFLKSGVYLNATDKEILRTAECCDIYSAMKYYFTTEDYEGSFEEYLVEELKWFFHNLNK